MQFRIFPIQLSKLLVNVQANGRHAVPGSEMHRDNVEFGLMMSADRTNQALYQALFEQARSFRYSIYPGRLLGKRQNPSEIPGIYWNPAFWQTEATLLQFQIELMGDDRRLTLDLEAYGKDDGAKPLTWGAFTSGTSSFGSLADLRYAMSPYLRLLARYDIVPLLHPANTDSVLFTEIADAVGGRVCAQFARTFSEIPSLNHDSMIYRDDLDWKSSRHKTSSLFIAPMRRRYSHAKISHGYYDTILRKYWHNRLSQLSSTEDGLVWIDDQYKDDWDDLGNQSWFDCTSPHYKMNEGVVEAYHFRGNTDHLSDKETRGKPRVNVAVGLEDRKEFSRRTNVGYNHTGTVALESERHTYLLGVLAGGSAHGLGYERAEPTSGGGHSIVKFELPTFTILLDFYLNTLAELNPTFAQRNPLMSVWGSASHGQQWFRVYWATTNEYVFEVVEKNATGNNGPGSVQVRIGAGPLDSRRRRLQVVQTPNSIQIWNDQGGTQLANFPFSVRLSGSLVLNYERLAPEGDFYSATGAAYDQVVIWNRALTKLPTMNYPFMESQV